MGTYDDAFAIIQWLIFVARVVIGIRDDRAIARIDDFLRWDRVRKRVLCGIVCKEPTITVK